MSLLGNEFDKQFDILTCFSSRILNPHKKHVMLARLLPLLTVLVSISHVTSKAPTRAVCSGTFMGDSSHDGDIIVEDGSTCLLSDTTVTGKVKVDRNCTLVVTNSVIEKDLEANDHSVLTISGSKIQGNIQGYKTGAFTLTESTVGKNVRLDIIDSSFSIEGSDISGQVMVKISEGSAETGAIVDNTIGGNIKVQDSLFSGVFEVSRNIMDVSQIQIQKCASDGLIGRLEVIDNESVGDLALKHNEFGVLLIVSGNELTNSSLGIKGNTAVDINVVGNTGAQEISVEKNAVESTLEVAGNTEAKDINVENNAVGETLTVDGNKALEAIVLDKNEFGTGDVHNNCGGEIIVTGNVGNFLYCTGNKEESATCEAPFLDNVSDSENVIAEFEDGYGEGKQCGPPSLEDKINAMQVKLTASDGASDDFFGWNVAVSYDGNTAVIGAFGDDVNGERSGSAYVFTRTATGEWVQQSKLLPDDGASEDFFGYDVAVSEDGNTVIIGAYRHGNFSGSATS